MQRRGVRHSGNASGAFTVLLVVAGFGLVFLSILPELTPMPAWLVNIEVLAFLAGAVCLALAVHRTARTWDRRRSVKHARHPSEAEWADDLDALANATGPQVAWDQPRTPTAWRHYLARAGFRAVVVLAVAVVAVPVELTVHHHDQQLLHDGVKARAVITDSDYGGRHSQDWIEVRYPVGDQQRVERIHGPGPDEYNIGEHLTVIYDPVDPGRVRTPSYANHNDLVDFVLFVMPFVGGLTGLDALLIALRSLRWQHWFRRRPWHTLRAEPSWFQPWYLKEDRCYLKLTGTTRDGVPVDTVVRVGSPIFQLDEDYVSSGKQVLVCVGPRHRAVLLTSRGEWPYDLRLPRSPRQEGRWRKRVAHGDDRDEE